MIHAFLLMIYLGDVVVSKDMYFRNINDCLYFAYRLNNQPQIPNRGVREGVEKFVSYTAVCVPKSINANQRVY